MNSKSDKPEDIKVLSHKEWPGFKLIFKLVFIFCLLWLSIIFIRVGL